MMESQGNDRTENMYFACRKRAAVYNEKLNSREIAADLLGISTSALAKHELGTTKCVPVDTVVLMSDLYGQPELRNWYCRNECPLGHGAPIATEIPRIEQIAVRLANCMDDDRIKGLRGKLLKIADDGVISHDEAQMLPGIMEDLDAFSKAVSELRMFAEKLQGGGDGSN